MAGLYKTPLRVYLALLVLSLIGIYSALHLPVSLFPNSSKPYANLCIGIDLTAEAFLKTYGESIEEQIRSIRRGSLQVETVEANYSPSRACFSVEFKWGGDNDEATREMENLRASLQGRLPPESRDRISLWSGRENGGFLALSFYSAERSLTDLYKILEPALMPKLQRVGDAKDPWLSNPQKRQISMELKPDTMATLQLFPSDVSSAVSNAMESYTGGSLTTPSGGLLIEYPKYAINLEFIKQIQVPTFSGRSVALSDVAHIDLTVPLDASRITKTSGAASVILYVTPKPGGNVKSMAEETLKIVNETMKTLPADLHYKNLVDPSQFIRSAIFNVTKEVALAAGLAVVILFLFVGNIKNVITAAIEIPLSLVLAFILMRISGMNLNLISLGGLALSAGMNVDASVVVMENIFRHFELANQGRDVNLNPLSYEERFKIIVAAVKEVRFAVIASTIASLVVFLPLAFTSDLTYAILGDLAKSVVFSHGFSAIVALILVPTIRLHVMKSGMLHEKPSILEGFLQKLESFYAKALRVFLNRKSLQISAMGLLAGLFIFLVVFVVPRLPREVIGKPDTDSIFVGISTSGNTLVRQMEAQTDQIENDIMNSFSKQVSYTFTQIPRANSSWILLRLKDKSEMKMVLKALEEKFPNTPTTQFEVESWNPAELPLPDPPDFKVLIRSSDREAMEALGRDLEIDLLEKKLFVRTHVLPSVKRDETVKIRPRFEQWPLLAAAGTRLSIASLADLTRTATEGRVISKIDLDGESMDAFMSFPQSYIATPEDLGALPIGIGGKILPLKALASLGTERSRPSIRRENGREAYTVTGVGNKDDKEKTNQAVNRAVSIVEGWDAIHANKQKTLSGESAEGTKPGLKDGVGKKVSATMQVLDPKEELNDALKQLSLAVSLSIGLIFLTMVFQFGSIMNSLLVLVAIPLGFIGVLGSLYLFKSTLSLNSLLGVILLNGLAVANSIILVDFLQRKVKEGIQPRLAAVEVAKVRLRPILMTSLTTGLGMLPVAFGFGEGGKILQPLGIAVAGGLCFSMLTTLFIVPALQVNWLEWLEKRLNIRKTQVKNSEPGNA